jgi:hypothetical protein
MIAFLRYEDSEGSEASFDEEDESEEEQEAEAPRKCLCEL